MVDSSNKINAFTDSPKNLTTMVLPLYSSMHMASCGGGLSQFVSFSRVFQVEFNVLRSWPTEGPLDADETADIEKINTSKQMVPRNPDLKLFCMNPNKYN